MKSSNPSNPGPTPVLSLSSTTNSAPNAAAGHFDSVGAVPLAGGVSPFRIERILESMREAEFDINHGIAEPTDNSTEFRGV